MKTNKIKSILIVTALSALMLAACSGGSSSLPDEYNYDDLSKYIKLGEYKGLEYSKPDLSVSDEEVKAEIDSTLQNAVEEVKVEEGTVTDTSVVNIDYVGSIDGVEFDGGTAQGQELDIANSSYIEGFAEGIVGHQVGETFDLHVTFPEDYGKEELKGKDAVFKTTINYMVEKKTPEYSDEWVKSNTEYKDKASYEASVKDNLLKDKKKKAESSAQSEVFSQISESSEVIEYPEKEYKARHDKIIKTYQDLADKNKVDLDTYVSSTTGLDTKAFNAEVKKAAQNTVKTELILRSIADAEGIKFSDKDYNEYLNGLLEDAGYTEETFKEERGQEFSDYAKENDLFMPYMYERVMTKVMEYSKQK
ncbi:MAG: trigger factor [Clostridiales bacterium]|nr:trigger factor [Clostridiales bacterium]